MAKTLTQVQMGNNDPPLTLQEYALRLVDKQFEAEELQIEAIEDMAQEFPPLYKVVRYAPGWGWSGKPPKSYTRFCREIYPTYVMTAELLYERFTKQKDTPNYGRKNDLEKPHKPGFLWEFMGQHCIGIREEVVAKFYEILPELKSQLDIDTKSQETQTFYSAMVRGQEDGGGGRTSTKMRRALEKQQFDDDE